MFDKIKAASGGTEILAVIENLPISANGFFLTKEQMTAIDAALASKDTISADLATANQNLKNSNDTLAAVQAKLTEKETAVSNLTAKVADLAGKEGAAVIISAGDPQATPKELSAKYRTEYDNL